MNFPFIKCHPEGTVLVVKVQPRSSKSQLVGLQDDSLKIKLMAPPVDGAANKACCAYLAKILGVAKGKVVLLSGEKSRQKVILLSGVDPIRAEKIISSILSQS